MIHSFTLYNAVMGMLASVGLVYLLYVEEFIIEYRTFLLVTTLGLLAFSLGSPLFALLFPKWIHLVHGVAALLVILGLYSPVHNDLRTDEWADLLWRDPRGIRHHEEWMTPMDDRILELFHSANLVLTPAIIAYNIGHSREEVNRRLSKLQTHGLVAKVDRGKYRITDLGQEYLSGRPARRRDGETSEDELVALR